MSLLTEIRTALAAALEALDAEVKVAPVGGKYEEQSERFVIRLTVGEPSDAAEAKLDDLLGTGPGSVRALLSVDPELGGHVSASSLVSHTGWRLFPRTDQPPVLGTELTVQTFL